MPLLDPIVRFALVISGSAALLLGASPALAISAPSNSGTSAASNSDVPILGKTKVCFEYENDFSQFSDFTFVDGRVDKYTKAHGIHFRVVDPPAS